MYPLPRLGTELSVTEVVSLLHKDPGLREHVTHTEELGYYPVGIGKLKL